MNRLLGKCISEFDLGTLNWKREGVGREEYLRFRTVNKERLIKSLGKGGVVDVC